jgi:tetratricopeptide (TPR) repeat protein
VKDRILSTFDHTLTLYREGRTDEVVSGCNLILQMDPLFDPAKKLLEKARNPASPINVNALMPQRGADALREAREAMAARDFQRAVQITTEILTNDLMNDDARILSDEAREKMEATPFVEQFVRKCEQHVKSGNMSAARTDLEKARALDGSHPAIAQMEQLIASKDAAPGSFDASSFVVDTPAPAPSRGSAQASDFGFTFEEDKGGQQQQPAFASFSFDSPAAPAPQAPPAAPPASDSPFAGGFSFDTPVTPSPSPAPAFSGFETPAKAPATGDFDFSTASMETSPDDQRKIEQYLQDGDRSFATGDYQTAIDLWSRIFLIDVTNDAASERIEKAKLLRRDAEQKLDSVIAAGIQAFDRRDFTTARSRFNEVLQVDRDNSTALDYLERIESAPSTFAPPPPERSYDDSVLDEQSLDDDPFDSALTPPSAGAAKAKGTSKAPSQAPKKSRSLGPVLAAVVAVVVLGGGWFAYNTFFGKAPVDQGATAGTIGRASALAAQGKFDQAIAMLRDIKPGDPQYDAALALIDDVQKKKQRAATMIDGIPAGQFYDERLAAARMAMDAHDYVAAKIAFEQATRVKPLPPDVKALYDSATQQVAKLDTAKALFAERKFQEVIAALQPMLEQDPQNRSIQRMIVDARFNLGAVALQQEKLKDAVREFDEVLKTDPNDELARRSRDLAQRYDGQQVDLLFRIYVKYLPLRQQPAA